MNKKRLFYAYKPSKKQELQLQKYESKVDIWVGIVEVTKQNFRKMIHRTQNQKNFHRWLGSIEQQLKKHKLI